MAAASRENGKLQPASVIIADYEARTAIERELVQVRLRPTAARPRSPSARCLANTLLMVYIV